MLEIVYRYDPEDPDRPERPADADRARDRLIQGNALFAELAVEGAGGSRRQVIPFDLDTVSGDRPGDAPTHQPFAAILSCSDARVPTELIFHQTLNDIFVVRLAGNVIANESVGSLNYAAQHLGGAVKLLVVLGHTGCGAVQAAVDGYVEPSNAHEMLATTGLRSVVDRIFVAVRTAAKALDGAGIAATEGEAYRARLTDLSVGINSALAAMTLQRILGPSIPPDCRVAFGVYDLPTRKVQAPGGSALAWAPASFDALEALARELARDGGA
jgi:carbonic anhydrase